MRFFNIFSFFLLLATAGCVSTNMSMTQKVKFGMTPIEVASAVGREPASSEVNDGKTRNLYGNDFGGFIFVEFVDGKVVEWGIESLVKKGMTNEEVEKVIGVKTTFVNSQNGLVRRVYGNHQLGWYYVDFVQGKAYGWGIGAPDKLMPTTPLPKNYYEDPSLKIASNIRWQKGNSKGIDNVFEEIISLGRILDNESLTELQKEDYSFSKLYGKDIYITTRVRDVSSMRIRGNSDDRWKPDNVLSGRKRDGTIEIEGVVYPIYYYFYFDEDSPDLSSFKNINKGDVVNVKGKLEKVDIIVSGDSEKRFYTNALNISIKSCEFFE